MIDIVSLVQSRGVSLTKNESKYIGCCPFHPDSKQDSLIVCAKENTFTCENCDLSGDPALFLSKFDGISKNHAQDLIKNGNELVFQLKTAQPKKATTTFLPCPLNEESSGQVLLKETIDYYHSHLFTYQPAIDFLTKRGLYNVEVLESLKVGFADRSLGLRLPDKKRKAGRVIRKNLVDLGIYRISGHAHFNGSIIVPIIDGDSIEQIYGRRLNTKSSKVKKHLILDQSDDCIFHKEALQQREIILCDTVLNALTFLCNGFENACCLLSEKTINDDLLELISSRKINRVYLALPSTEETEKTFAKVADKIKNIGVEVHQMRFLWGMDANKFLVEKGKDELEKLYRNSEWIGGGLNKEIAIKIDDAPSISEQKPTLLLESKGDFFHVSIGDCEYRIGGLEKNNSMEVMKITLRVSCDGLIHIDSLDLYKDNDRRKFIDRVNEELLLDKSLVKRDLAKILLELEQLQENRIYQQDSEPNTTIEINEFDLKSSLDFLKSENLLEKICQSFNEIGLIGGESNKMVAYLALVSRKLTKPLAVVIQSSSASGKSALMDGVLSFFPAEEQLNYSAITGQSLFYQQSLKNKILAISEEIGFERAGGSLKLLQSQGYLSISSTSKDSKTGKMTSVDYHVDGPIALIFTTTSINLDEELMNRCLVLNLEEDESITQLIHDQQRHSRTLDGLIMKETKQATQKLMQNIQRLIKAYHVINPYAPHLTFSSTRSRTRRDHEKYLTLIDSIALLRQYQKTVKVVTKLDGSELEYIEVDLTDIEYANSLAPEIFGHSLDELSPQTRRILSSIQQFIKAKQAKHPNKAISFTRREVRELIGWSETQVRNHIQKLEAMEYIVKNAGKQGALHSYSLLITDSNKCDIGIIDTQELKKLKSATTIQLRTNKG